MVLRMSISRGRRAGMVFGLYPWLDRPAGVIFVGLGLRTVFAR